MHSSSFFLIKTKERDETKKRKNETKEKRRESERKKMILTPTYEEIRIAYEEVERINNPIDRYSNIILVPHAGIHESRVVALTAMRYLPEHSPVVIIGTDHYKISRQMNVFRDDDVWKMEHSFRINAALLEFLGHTKQEYLILDSSEISLELLLDKLYDGWSLVFTSDLSHYVPEYTAMRMENPYIERLTRGEIVEFKDEFNKHGPCGTNNINLFSRVLRTRNECGRVVEYRHSPGTEVVGYAGIVAGEKKWLKLLTFDFRFLVKCVRVTILDVLNGRSAYTPSWPVWKYYKQGAFVTVKDSRTRACIGRFESNMWDKVEYNTMNYITRAATECVQDAKDRWNRPLSLDEFNRLNFTIEVLSPRSGWKEHTGNEILQLGLTYHDDYGFYIKYETGENGTFLPDVWKELSTLTIEELLVLLEKKILGYNSYRWKNPGTAIYLYNTLTVTGK